MMRKSGLSRVTVALGVVVVILVIALAYTGFLLLQRPPPPPPAPGLVAVLTGKVLDAKTGKPLPGASISLNGYVVSAGPDGTYSITVPVGSYSLRVEYTGYEEFIQSIDLSEARTYTLDVSLSALPLPTPQFVEQNKLVYESGATFQWLDPHVTYYGYDYLVIWNTVENLVWFREGNVSDIIPWLAESYSQIDETTWEFKIRRGIKFQDGTVLNATAVWFSLTRLLILDGTAPTGVHGSQAAWMIQQFIDPEGELFTAMGGDPAYDEEWVRRVLDLNFVEVIDDYTVRIHLKVPTTQLLPVLAGGPLGSIISPTSVIKGDYEYHGWPYEEEQKPVDYIKYFIRMAGNGDTAFNLPVNGWKIGTGPYYIESVDPSTYKIVLKAYDDYWGGPDGINLPPEGKDRIETIEFVYQPSFTTRLLDLKQGTATVIDVSPADIFQVIDRDAWLQNGIIKSIVPGVSVWGPQPTLVTWWINLNTNVTNPDGSFREWQPFADWRIRLAFASALNVTHANIYLNNRFGIVAYNLIPPGTYPPGTYNPDIKPIYSFNLTRAEELLLDAWKNPMTSATHEMHFYNGTRIPPGVVDNTFGPDRPRVIEIYVQSGATTFIQLATQLADNLNAITRKHGMGLTFRVVIVPGGQQYTLASLHQIDAYFGGWGADYNHVLNWLQPMLYSRGTYPSWNLWNITRLDELYWEAVEADAAGDIDRLIEISNEMNRIANQLIIYIYLWHPTEYLVHSSWLNGFTVVTSWAMPFWSTAYYESPG
jgi:ABC-type transport system substrate-binding protein